MEKANKTKKLSFFLPVFISLLILFILTYPKYEEIINTIKSAKMFFLILSLIFANLSYFLMGLSLYETLKIMRHKISIFAAWAIAMVSSSVNYFLSTGGISGFAVRAHLLSKRKVPYSISLTSSVVISVFIYLVLDIILIFGFIYQFIKTHTMTNQLLEGFIGSIIILFVATFLISILYNHEFRSIWAKKIYHGINHIVYFFSKREILEEDFFTFESQLNEGILKIHENKYEIPKVVAYITLDWLVNLVSLYFAFQAINVKISFSQLIIGFAFGMIMTVIPVLPGGLGAMEAAMATAYAGMGIGWGSGIVAALIFRVFYYIIPSIISLFVYMVLKMSEPHYHYTSEHTKHKKSIKEKINYDI